MNTTSRNDQKHGRHTTSSRITRGLVVAVGAAVLASGALALAATPAVAATPGPVGVHTAPIAAYECYGFWDGCEMGAARLSATSTSALESLGSEAVVTGYLHPAAVTKGGVSLAASPVPGHAGAGFGSTVRGDTVTNAPSDMITPVTPATATATATATPLQCYLGPQPPPCTV